MHRKLTLAASLAAAGLLALGGSAVAGCFGATEIRVEVTTTASCANGIGTQLFVGAPGTTDFGMATAADTRDCRDAEPRIGTLSIVPSGARDGQFDMQVVAGVGVDPAVCRPGHLDGCIVVRRRVSFREHQSKRVPVLLSVRCIGITCGGEESCDLGTCAKLADCTEVGCPRERGDVDAGPPPAGDAGADADADADAGRDASVAPDASIVACSAVADTVVAGQSIRGQLALQGKTIHYVNGTGSSAELRHVPATANATAQGVLTPNLLAVTATDAELAYARIEKTTGGTKLSIVRQKPGVAPTVGSWASESTDAIAIYGAAIVGVTDARTSMGLAAGFRGFAYDTARPLSDFIFFGLASEIVVDQDGEWYGVAAGSSGLTLFHFAAAAATPGQVLSGAGPSPDIAVSNRTVYVALQNTPGGAGIHGIPRADFSNYTAAPLVPNVTPSTLAAFGTDLYYIEAGALVLLDLKSAGVTIAHPLTTVGPNPTALAVDADCVYWVEEGKRIMRRARH